MAQINKTTLIVNYLPQTLTDEEFTSLFVSVGQVTSSKIVRDRATGYSYGFGFVEYNTEEEAFQAIQALNGLQLQNKTIKVAYSRQGEKVKGANLYVRNLPKSCTAEDLEQVFAGFGEIIQCRVLTDQNTGQSKGVGFVLYNTKDEAEQAMNSLNGTMPYGFTEAMAVTCAEDKGKQKAQQFLAQQQPVMSVVNSIPGYGMGGEYIVPVAPSYGAIRPRGGFRGRIRGAPRGLPRGGPIRSQGPRHRYNPMASSFGVSPVATLGGGGVSNAPGHILFAYNIGPNTGEEELRQLFAMYGTITKVNVIRDQQTQVGKGYGFVTMPNYEEASYAIQQLNGYNFAGKPMQVSFKSNKQWSGNIGQGRYFNSMPFQNHINAELKLTLHLFCSQVGGWDQLFWHIFFH